MIQQFPDLNKYTQDKNQKLEGVQNLKYQDIIESSFTSLVVGKPGQGKSTLIEQLLLNPDLYYKKFDFVLIISPTKFKNLQLDENNSIDHFSMPWIIEKLDLIRKQCSENKQQNLLIIFDDVISEIKENERAPFLIQLFYNRRHLIPDLTISLLITTQKYNLCPLKLRTVLTSLYIFDVGLNDWEMIKKEQLKIDKRELNQICQQAYGNHDNLHSFIYFRINPFKICIDFKPIITSSELMQITRNLNKKDDQIQKQPIEIDDQITVVQGNSNNEPPYKNNEFYNMFQKKKQVQQFGGGQLNKKILNQYFK